MKLRQRSPLYVGLLSLSTMLGLKALSGQIAFSLVLNLSTSMPAGVYRIIPARQLQRGMLVLFSLPDKAKRPLVNREWLNMDMPLLKPVAAIPGDAVCVNKMVVVNGRELGGVFTSDSRGRPLTAGKGCYVVSENAFLPLSLHSAHSYDGRYFGEVSQESILGEAVPVVTW